MTLQDKHKEAIDEWHQWRTGNTKDIAQSCTEITEAFAVDFGEWITENAFVTAGKRLWRNLLRSGYLTTTNLLKEYKQHLETLNPTTNEQ